MKVLLTYMNAKSNEHDLTLKKIKEVLVSMGIDFKAKLRSSVSVKDFNVDLVIVAGGDGTFLRMSHFSNGVPMFGVNTDPKFKEGFFMRAVRGNFEKKFDKVLRGKYQVLNLLRLEAKINGKKVKNLALNEFYIGSEKPYLTSRYLIKVGGKEELQKSSGVIVSTPAGANSWAVASGGKKLSLGSRKFQYVVREPYTGKLTKSRLVKRVLKNGEKIFIRSRITNGILIADSVGEEFKFKDNALIEIKASKNNLKLVHV